MRARSRAAGLGLVIGLAVGCYNDDYLLGALCKRDNDCGGEQCCSNRRCRTDTDCGLIPGEVAPFVPAYSICTDPADCLEHGIPHCVVLPGATRGFCADLCVGNPNLDCDLHVFGAPLTTLPRTCVEQGGQSLCALDCSSTNICPEEMQCQEGVCVPTP